MHGCQPLHVSLVATPDSQVSPLQGLFETFETVALLCSFGRGVPKRPFHVEIIASDRDAMRGASGLPLEAHHTCDEVPATDIAIVPLMVAHEADWVCGRYPGLVDWLREVHAGGATLCSACTGVLLLAETGLLRGGEATIPGAFAPTFRRNFPDVRLRPDEVLITSGNRRELIMSAGGSSWRELALHLIARHVSPAAARAMAPLLMLQWHREGQAPHVSFAAPRNHGDARVHRLQDWLALHYRTANPVEAMALQAGLPLRAVERRFARATGYAPIRYVQALRIEEAKRRLESTGDPIDEIGFQVGYENAAFFRRLFKRSTRMTPGAYRRRFEAPSPVPENRLGHRRAAHRARPQHATASRTARKGRETP